MKRYRAVLFDLFDTVAPLDREKLPLFAWRGSASRATTGELQPLYEANVPDIPFESFVEALHEVAREQQETRSRDLREVPCAVRFTRTLRRIGLPESPSTDSLASRLARIHSSMIGGAAEVPRDHVQLLERLRCTHALALVSNFDDSATAQDVLRRGAVLGLFHTTIISVDHGWRKPSASIFERALASLAVTPRDALFVGDSAEEDIAGARRVGMDAVWVNAAGCAFPDQLPAPTHVIAALPALLGIVDSDI
jgi:FMN phosphatase YigB (HAD superfamily)